MGAAYRLVTSEFFQNTGLARRFTMLMGRIADLKVPGWLLRTVIRQYIKRNSIDMSDFGVDLRNYRTFNQFFTRALLPGSRLFWGDISSPAEGLITAAGPFTQQQLFHVKGSFYPLDELLGKPGPDNGSFATIYLSPADYHRVHTPFDCTILSIRHLHGNLRTVNPVQLRNNPLLYCQNERVVLEGDSGFGPFFLVLVGAIVVGKIKLSFIEGFTRGFNMTNLSLSLTKGDEIGCFELGSTVILVMQNELLSRAEPLSGKHFKLGQSLISEQFHPILP